MARSSLPEGDISTSTQDVQPWIGTPVPLFPLLAECLGVFSQVVLICGREKQESGKEACSKAQPTSAVGAILWSGTFGCHSRSRPVLSEGCICIGSWCLWLVWAMGWRAPSSRKELQGWVPESLDAQGLAVFLHWESSLKARFLGDASPS